MPLTGTSIIRPQYNTTTRKTPETSVCLPSLRYNPSRVESIYLDVGTRAVMVALYVGGPILIISLVVGLAVSILQAVTSVQEQTLAFVPKIIATAIALIVFGPFMLRVLTEFSRDLFISLPALIR